ncbi:alpha/beta-hydrolase [Dichomitus squalens]|uniref:Carboxylic ester hydrolase n=1 Tax=Dichomitus squalens TaxID=114155 RepID=A0A4Q9Q2P5_9APHY|nr:alpha/beta-hydrolase [Dichomitus squalens]TBU61399.1 alpha/beta-hydrolase [Dichomitus squalens]
MPVHTCYLFVLLTVCPLALLSVLASPHSTASSSDLAVPPGAPIVTLDNATVFGTSDGWTNSFLGIPFAQPPFVLHSIRVNRKAYPSFLSVGELRLSLPKPVLPYSGVINASYWGNQCINTLFLGAQTVPSYYTPEMVDYLGIFTVSPPAPFDENCLNLNVIAPANTEPGDKLPVIAYIFFSDFDFGGSYNVDGRIMVNRSHELKEPVIWVSMNYRLGPFGFLPGREVGEAGVGNLGLQDQRQALRWIQKYISAFGGDPDKVTLLGLSSGATSATLHTIANGGNSESLFRALWAESGAIQHSPWIDSPAAQATYDAFADALGCSGAPDSLDCMRQVPVENFTTVAQSGTFWLLTADGTFIRELPQLALARGQVSRATVVTGIAEDEGTLPTLAFPNGANDTLLQEFVKGSFPNITDKDMSTLLGLYPNDPSLGAPYGTGHQYELAPQYKRIASLSGDISFDSNHRLYARSLVQQGIDVYSYYYERLFVSGFGVTHGSELPNMYQAGDMADMFIHFVNRLDPNGSPSQLFWPKYTLWQPTMLTFTGNKSQGREGSFGHKDDTYRAAEIDFINYLNLNVN